MRCDEVTKGRICRALGLDPGSGVNLRSKTLGFSSADSAAAASYLNRRPSTEPPLLRGRFLSFTSTCGANSLARDDRAFCFFCLKQFDFRANFGWRQGILKPNGEIGR